MDLTFQLIRCQSVNKTDDNNSNNNNNSKIIIDFLDCPPPLWALYHQESSPRNVLVFVCFIYSSMFYCSGRAFESVVCFLVLLEIDRSTSLLSEVVHRCISIPTSVTQNIDECYTQSKRRP